MNKIGNYIHLHYENYKLYGINAKRENSVGNGESLGIQAIKNKNAKTRNLIDNIRSSFSKQELEEYENAVELLLNLNKYKDVKLGDNAVTPDMIANYCIASLEQGFEGQKDNFNILSSGDVVEKSKLILDLQAKLAKQLKLYKTDSEGNKIDTIRVSIDAMLRRVQELYVGLSKENPDYKELRNKLLDLSKRLQEQNKKIDNVTIRSGLGYAPKMMPSSNASTMFLQKGAINQSGYFFNLQTKQGQEKAHEFIKELDELYTKINAASIMNNLKGFHLENVGALAGLMGGQYTLDAFNKSVQQIQQDLKKDPQSRVILTGDKITSSAINKSNISGGLLKGNNVTLQITPSYSKQKIDMTFTWNNKTMTVFAKNTNLRSSHKDLSLVSGTNLLYWLSRENADYVNHYLNIASAHNETGDSNSSNSLLKIAHESVGLVLLYGALTGKKSDNDIPEIILINDNSTSSKKSVRAISTKDIAKKAAKRLDKYASITMLSGGDKDFYSMRFKNDKVAASGKTIAQASQERRIHLLNDVHERKLRVSLNKDFISKNYF